MEAEILRYLIDNEGKVVSRQNMLTAVWDCAKTPIPGY
jgi:DNA-binding winged helix-turn-helix (wHTH) protein